MHRCHTMIDAHKWELMSLHVRVRWILDESRRAVKHVRARVRARFLRTHRHLRPLTASHTALAVRVMARARRESRGCECFLGTDLKGKKHLPLNFQYVALLYNIYIYIYIYIYILLSIIYGKSTLLSIICKKSLFKVFVCTILHGS